MSKSAIIIGAGPAGLTAAYELLKRTDIIPIILERSGDIGGISKTVNYKGNRMDIGGHRFFSKSDRVMEWWLNILPIEPTVEKQIVVTYQRNSRTVRSEEAFPALPRQEESDKVMLVRKRLSRIYFLRRFFTYPIQLSLDTLRKLGVSRTFGILISYTRSRLFPRKPEKSLEDFFINRFGDNLYRLFFKDYTEKVWGVPCTEISAEWGAQRIKGISIAKAIAHAVKSIAKSDNGQKGIETSDISQKGTETSLIEKFLYPKFGPGQLWEEVARQVQEMGGRILMNQRVMAIRTEGDRVTAIEAVDGGAGEAGGGTGETTVWEGDYFFSTMPVQELIAGMKGAVPGNVREVAAGLQYRDFITVGVLLSRLPNPEDKAGEAGKRILPDTWIYIQEKDVKVGRLQIFNNWSPFMVKDPDTVWVGMEYFCDIKDEFWGQPDPVIQSIAIRELEKMGLARVEDVLDSTVLRVEKTYPAYFGTYDRFGEIREFTDRFANLFLVGRNGMHKYNNSDHSMLTAMVAVDNIVAGVAEKSNVWEINTEQEYHEEKAGAGAAGKNGEVGAGEKPAGVAAGSENVGVAAKDKNAGRTAPSPGAAVALPAFSSYLFKDRSNRWYAWIAAIGIVLQFCVFKHFYPYAGFISGDSYVYLETAYWNFDVNTYPIGYSRFLRAFSVFTTSDMALVAFQYLLIQVSALYCLFTIFYFYKPGKWAKAILFAAILFNPVFLYLSNYVLSDALFLSLSLVWFAQLLWIIHRPTARRIVLHALVLFLAFTVRYNAMYYPLVSALAFALSRQKVWIKLAGTGAGILAIALFMLHTSNVYYSLTGIREFSPFSGWQMANNAMYAYRYVNHKDTVDMPARFRSLDRAVRTYFDTTRDVKKHPEEMLEASTVYMWDPASPLQKYMNDQFRKDSMAWDVKRWATVAPLYADYGSYLIRKYPMTFAAHYLWPNARKYYAPPVEFLETYNMGIDSIDQIARIWFRYNSDKIKSAFHDLKEKSLGFYPVLAGALNVVFLVALLGFIFLDGIRRYPLYRDILLLAAGLWLINFGFSVFASPIALRFQLFPMLVCLSLSVLLIERICAIAFIKPID